MLSLPDFRAQVSVSRRFYKRKPTLTRRGRPLLSNAEHRARQRETFRSHSGRQPMARSPSGSVCRIAVALALAAVGVLSCRAALAQGVEQPNLAVMLDWVIQGTHAPFFVAEAKGYYKAEGLTVRLDPGKGARTVANT